MIVPVTTSDSAAAISTTTHVVQFNLAAQLPIKLQVKLKAQLVMLLNGHNLLEHLTSAKFAPPTTITQTDSTLSNLEYEMWSHTRIFSLRDQLQNLKKVSQTVATYLQEIRSIADALKVASSPVADDELAVKILSGLGHEYREITAAIRARDTTLSFKELFQKLMDHELFLKHQYIEKSSSIIMVAVAQRTNFQPQHQKNNRRFPNQSSKPQDP
ncbi:uncharacterized protein [Solanum tuberosum]|uniref:uncharacterized protein n=1 Tax=Solanum tuberosum TaxID=4113 RepID=UPI00073A34FF|nr:PREDICTED: uncharacterized protein LOC107061681 [Solanum tuberosum]